VINITESRTDYLYKAWSRPPTASAPSSLPLPVAAHAPRWVAHLDLLVTSRVEQNSVIYAKAFFDLQLQFAHKVTELSGLPFARVLFEYTNLYIRFGLSRDFNPAHPTWQAYLAGLQDTNDRREWTYRLYLTRSEAMSAPPVVATFGCVSYALLSGDRIRLHFQNAETDGHSPLGVERLGHRRADLTALFGHVKRILGERVQVVGASWLYTLDAYRRCFRSRTSRRLACSAIDFNVCPSGGNF
jgi:hypothetical protein